GHDVGHSQCAVAALRPGSVHRRSRHSAHVVRQEAGAADQAPVPGLADREGHQSRCDRQSGNHSVVHRTGESLAGAIVSSSRGLMLGMLCFVYVLNFLDRQLVSILAKPIQDALQITDGQLGRITGFYFALFYCFIAIPVGWLADRTNRVKVLSIACGLWSAATAACGMAANYGQLVVARMAVGVGEAGGVPPSYAIISDSFPRARRGAALAIFNLGPPFGSALGVAFGASLAAAFDWRLPFYVIGAVGVVTAIAVYLLVAEPERGGQDAVTVAT